MAVILEHHGAALAVESEPLRGTTFRVTFPAAGGPWDGDAEAAGQAAP